MPSLKNSTYWKNQIDITENQIAELLHSETFDIKSGKSDADNLVFQSIKERVESLRVYLSYCERKYEEALQEESGKAKKVKSILYFERENGY